VNKMKITKTQLKQIIKEELENTLQQEGVLDKLKSMVGLGPRFDFWWLNKNPTIGKSRIHKDQYEQLVFDVRDYLESDGNDKSRFGRTATVFHLPFDPSIGRPGSMIPANFWSEKASAIIKDPVQTVQNYISETTGEANFFGNRSPFVDRSFAGHWGQSLGGSKNDVWHAGSSTKDLKINTQAFKGGEPPQPGHPLGILPTYIYNQLSKALSLYQRNTADFEKTHAALGAILDGTAPEEVVFAIKSTSTSGEVTGRMSQLLNLIEIAHQATSVMMDSNKRAAIIDFLKRGY